MAEDKIKSDVVGFRLDPEDRERLKQFMEEEGKGNKEFMTMLLNGYELNKGKAKNINLLGDIEELEQYTNKIQQAFINIIGKLEGQKENIIEEKDRDLLIYKEKVNNLKSDNELLKVDNSLVTEKLTTVNNDNISLKEHNNQLQGNLSDKVTIIEEYKGKNDMLLSQLRQYEKYPEQIETIKGLLADSQAREIEKDNVIRDKEYMIQSKDNSIIELSIKHKEELQTIKDRTDLAKDKAILESQKEFNIKMQQQQDQLQHLQEKYNNSIEEYQAKYKQLLEELEQIKKVKPQAKDTIKK